MNNPFALLGEDGEDSPPAPAKTVAAPAKAPAAVKAKEPSAPKPASDAKSIKPKGSAHPPAQEPDSPAAIGRGDGAERGERGKGGKGGRGRKDGEEGRPPRQREFDRHVPGNGRRDTEKRGGAGKANWGTPTDVLQEDKKETVENTEEPTEDAKEETEAPDTEMTLSEYEKNLMEKRNALLSSYTANKRTVTVDKALQNNILKKKDEDSTFAASKIKEAKAKEAKAKVKEIVESGFRIKVDEAPRREDRPFGGKGDRGKGEGRGKGKGGGKGKGDSTGTSTNARRTGGPGFNANVMDESSFPSLGAK